jgi:hypothetical protein
MEANRIIAMTDHVKFVVDKQRGRFCSKYVRFPALVIPGVLHTCLLVGAGTIPPFKIAVPRDSVLCHSYNKEINK